MIVIKYLFIECIFDYFLKRNYIMDKIIGFVKIALFIPVAVIAEIAVLSVTMCYAVYSWTTKGFLVT